MTCDLVSGTIVARSREPEGLRTMMTLSSVAHATGIAALIAASWAFGPHPSSEAVLMQISFPGASAPVSTDVTVPTRREPEVRQAPRLPRPAQARPPAPKPEEMVESVTKSAPKPAVPLGTDSALSEGGLSTIVLPEMNARSANIDFCDPEYLGHMVASIHRHWQQNQRVAGRPIVRFVIRRDGTLADITLRQPSGYPGLDLDALRAVHLTHAIPPLPACYPHPQYAMNLTFEYIR